VPSAHDTLRADVSSTRPKMIDGVTLQRSRELRRDATDAETKLWYALRARAFGDFKFRRQYPIGKFIADFCCVSKKLIVELDGSQHAEQQGHDQERTSWFEKHGYRVIRFWNFEVAESLADVLDRIEAALDGATAPSPADALRSSATSPATKRER
jgi:very-short-patch-repair endonuclease